MHDPMTQAFEIPIPVPRNKWGYRPPLVTIWHVDPETDNSDDSCGWFMRCRHGDKAVLSTIRKEFAFEWDSKTGGWFHANGYPRLSVPGVTLNMFRRAAFVIFGSDWGRTEAFMRRNLYDILMFAENNADSLFDSIVMRYGQAEREGRIDQFASIVYGWILRTERPWYRHPRWHLHHWKVQIHPLQNFKRWAFSRCKSCGKGFSWGYCPIADGWGGEGPTWFRGEPDVRHADCSRPKDSFLAGVAGGA